jgi:hypothetical protein
LVGNALAPFITTNSVAKNRSSIIESSLGPPLVKKLKARVEPALKMSCRLYQLDTDMFSTEYYS